jgi:hypothetical protein
MGGDAFQGAFCISWDYVSDNCTVLIISTVLTGCTGHLTGFYNIFNISKIITFVFEGIFDV